MSDELDTRLRAKHQSIGGNTWCFGDPINPDGPEAADRIKALEDEIKRLKQQIAGSHRSFHHAVATSESGAGSAACQTLGGNDEG